MNYGALGPFVRSFILLVDPGDICPPHLRRATSSRGTGSAVEEAQHWREWRCNFSHVVTGAPGT
jgi:hypothetical protein